MGESSDMMSITDFDGEAVQLPRDQSRFVFEIYSEWAGSNRHRLRQLAILQLLGNGWAKSDISRAMESNRSNITRSINRARASLSDFAQNKGYNLVPSERGIE
jgi:hypothetical protein